MSPTPKHEECTYTWIEIHRFYSSALKDHNGLKSATVFCLKNVFQSSRAKVVCVCV